MSKQPDVLDTETPDATEGFGVRVDERFEVEGLRGIAVRAAKPKDKKGKPFLSLQFICDVSTEAGLTAVSVSVSDELSPAALKSKAALEAFIKKAESHTVGMFIPTADALVRITGIGDERPYGRLVASSNSTAPMLLWAEATSLRVKHAKRPF